MPANEPHNTYYVYPYLTGFLGRTLLLTTGEAEDVRAWGTLDDNGDLIVLLVNNSAEMERRIAIEISGASSAGPIGEMFEIRPHGDTPNIQDNLQLTINDQVSPGWAAVPEILPMEVHVAPSFALNIPASAIQFIRIPLG